MTEKIRKISKNREIYKENFIKKATQLHAGLYDYSSIIYINDKTDIVLKCSVHGNFIISPNNHLRGQGCRLCGEKRAAEKITKPVELYFSEVSKIHNNKYDYSKSIYTFARNKILIICPTHGEFSQTASSHLKSGCPKCSNWISKMESNWLDSLGISIEFRQKLLFIDKKRIKVDAFVPETNTVYEFWGDYWHGNPKKYNPNDVNLKNKKTFGELYKDTLSKRELILKSGYNLIEKWETE